ncbi:MAG: signal peptidase I [Lachnospiraceae bacterium]|jgi:signal peptidase|nr:signal peptidase I [Lachnospiraceae bacterium]
MKKSKFATALLTLIILLYGLFSKMLLTTYANIYTYFINPLFWIGLAIFLRVTLNIETYKNQKLKVQIINYVLIGSLVYIITYLLSGLFVTFGTNPYSTTLLGLATNIWLTGSVFIGREYVRYRLINNVYNKYKVKFGIAIIIVFTLVELLLNNFNILDFNFYYLLKSFCSAVLPVVARNILFTYIALYCNSLGSILYESITHIFLWTVPLFPKAPWIMIAFVDTVIPLTILFYTIYIKNRKDINKLKLKNSTYKPYQIIPIAILIVLFIWFIIGVFPVRPLAIATGSMSPTINAGDVVILKKSKIEDIQKGDVIEFTDEYGNTVVHRAVDIKNQNGQIYITTKGDNNSKSDSLITTSENFKGKILFKIKYIGYPAVWLSKMK